MTSSANVIDVIEAAAVERFHADASLTFTAARMAVLADADPMQRQAYFELLHSAYSEQQEAARAERLQGLVDAAVADALRPKDSK